jgi:hypothetical protein
LEYNLNKNSKVLDPCAGWGGRMIGISVVSNTYHCFEPSTLTFKGLNKLYEFIRKINPEFECNVENKPFEDSVLKENYYDFAITSPPYYDTEIYSDEETNSLNRYKNFESWKDYFYLPLIENTMSSLKETGTFILNIGSRVYPLNEILLSTFNKKYKINKIGNYLSGSSGLGKKGEGEMFYEIRK